jgi:hypothetical protein
MKNITAHNLRVWREFSGAIAAIFLFGESSDFVD